MRQISFFSSNLCALILALDPGSHQSNHCCTACFMVIFCSLLSPPSFCAAAVSSPPFAYCHCLFPGSDWPSAPSGWPQCPSDTPHPFWVLPGHLHPGVEGALHLPTGLRWMWCAQLPGLLRGHRHTYICMLTHACMHIYPDLCICLSTCKQSLL